MCVSKSHAVNDCHYCSDYKIDVHSSVKSVSKILRFVENKYFYKIFTKKELY